MNSGSTISFEYRRSLERALHLRAEHGVEHHEVRLVVEGERAVVEVHRADGAQAPSTTIVFACIIVGWYS